MIANVVLLTFHSANIRIGNAMLSVHPTIKSQNEMAVAVSGERVNPAQMPFHFRYSDLHA
jgi:hypothetical protein